MSEAPTVEVQEWVVLYAVRHGLARGAPAYAASLALLEEHADRLARWQSILVRDVRASMSRPHPFRGPGDDAAAGALLVRLGRKGWSV